MNLDFKVEGLKSNVKSADIYRESPLVVRCVDSTTNNYLLVELHGYPNRWALIFVGTNHDLAFVQKNDGMKKYILQNKPTWYVNLVDAMDFKLVKDKTLKEYIFNYIADTNLFNSKKSNN